MPKKLIQPLVTIIVPTYNRAHIIGETLDSVLAQTYQNWECIVVDDGSTDGTAILMKGYIENDDRFQYHHRPKERLPGGNEARNYGFEVSRGAYINWLDSDDLFSKKKLEIQISEILTQAADVSICKWGYFKNGNKDDFTLNNRLSKHNIQNGFSVFDYYGLEHTFLPNHNFLVKRSTVIKSGLWNINLTVNQDGEFFTRVLLNSQIVTYADSKECYVLYRKISGQNSRITTEKKAAELYLSLKLIETQLLLANVPPTHPFLIYYKNAVVKKAFKFKKVLPKDKLYYRFLLSNYMKILKRKFRKRRKWNFT